MKLLLPLLLLVTGTLAGCTSDAVTTLSVADWKTEYEATPDAFLLDVRTPGEYQQAHLEGATLIPYDVLKQYEENLPTDKDTPIFVYCRSGNRSGIASGTLVDLGYTQVYNMAGGINDWISMGYPVVTGA